MNKKSLLSEIPTIEIKGQVGSGKTALAVLIKTALQEYGVNANITEYCGNEIEQYPEEYANINLAACMVHFKDSTVQINTHQLKRDYLEGKSIPFDEIEFTETPTNIVKEAIEEYNKTQSELSEPEFPPNFIGLPDNFIGFRP
jgi:Ni2+-binding GTPase involved in maturation of urease and hydrogenase